MQQLRPIPAFVVFLSGYWPLAIIIAVVDFDWDQLRFATPWTVGAFAVLMILACIFTAWHFSYYKKGDRVTVISVEDRSVELLNYAIPYIAGFAGIETGRLGHIWSMLIILWVVFYTTYKTHTVVVNPFLLSLGYRLFAVEFEWPGGERETVLAVSDVPVAPKDVVRIRSIATSCTIIVAVLRESDIATDENQ